MDSSTVEAGNRHTSIFTILAVVFALISLVTPIILLTLPLMATAAMAIVAMVRKENPRWVSPVVIVFCAFLVFGTGSTLNNISGKSSSNLAAVKLEDWSWNPDPSFGSNGTIKWRVAVHNVSERAIRNVKVDFSTYDKSGKLLASTFSYVDAIPPGESRTDESYADLYGREDSARAVISEVHFSDE